MDEFGKSPWFQMTLATVVGAVVNIWTGILVQHWTEQAPQNAEKLIERASKLVPGHRREEYLQIQLADLDCVKGNWKKVVVC